VQPDPLKLGHRTPPPEPEPVTEADLGPLRTSIAVLGVMWFAFLAFAAALQLATWREGLSGPWPWRTCVKLIAIALPGLAATLAAFKFRRIAPRSMISDDDDPEWHALEHDPKFIESIARARAQVRAGETVAHEVLKAELNEK
jgi:hypothetical protein